MKDNDNKDDKLYLEITDILNKCKDVSMLNEVIQEKKDLIDSFLFFYRLENGMQGIVLSGYDYRELPYIALILNQCVLGVDDFYDNEDNNEDIEDGNDLSK